MGLGEEGGLIVVVVTGGAIEGVDLALGVGFDGIVFEGGEDCGSEGFFLFGCEVEAGRFPTLFIGSEAALVGPVFEVGEFGGRSGGGGESFVAGCAVQGGGEGLSADGIAGREFRGIGSVFTSGGFGEVGGEGGGFFIGEAEVGHFDRFVMLLGVFEEGE